MDGKRLRRFTDCFARPRGPLLAPLPPAPPAVAPPRLPTVSHRNPSVANKVSGVKRRVERLHDNYRLRQYALMEGVDNCCYEEWEWRMWLEMDTPYASPSSIMGETITEADEGTGQLLLLPELADLVPTCSPAASPNPQYQAAPTHPTSLPAPMAAWGAPAANGGAAAVGSLYQRPANAVSTGFTPAEDISVNTLWSSPSSPPSSSRSKADEWLASTLQSMTVGGGSGQGTPLGPLSPRMTTSSASCSTEGGTPSSGAPPPAHPPPPLPPAAVLASPDRPVGERLFERQENIAPVQWAANGVQPVQQLQHTAAGKSAFPTVFSPEQPFAPSAFPAAAAAAVNVQPVQQAPAVDPFDVQWSRLALSPNGRS